jgi:hypothetical protein
VTNHESQLRPDGTIFPPVTPDPPSPPGYEAPSVPESDFPDAGEGEDAGAEPPD